MYYNGLGWMLQYLPEEFKSKEVCLEVCKRYPYAIRYVPNEFVEDDSFWNELLSNGCYTPLLNLEKDQEKHLSNKYRDFKKRLRKMTSYITDLIIRRQKRIGNFFKQAWC